jgi:hypothetical protein
MFELLMRAASSSGNGSRFSTVSRPCLSCSCGSRPLLSATSQHFEEASWGAARSRRNWSA